MNTELMSPLGWPWVQERWACIRGLLKIRKFPQIRHDLKNAFPWETNRNQTIYYRESCSHLIRPLSNTGWFFTPEKKKKAKQEPNSSYWNRWRGNNVICNRSGKSGEAMHCLLLNIVTPVFGTLLKADCWTTTSYWINFCKYFPHYIENQEYFSAINLLIQLIPLSPVQKKKLSIAFIHSLILLIPLLTF